MDDDLGEDVSAFGSMAGSKPRKRVLLLDLPIAGLQHYVTVEEVRELNENDRLVLVREPHNNYDKNAIRIDTVDGTKLGYVPRTFTQMLAAHIDRAACEYQADVGDLISPKRALCHFRLWLV